MVPRKESGSVSRFAHLEGLADIESKRTLKLLPYSVGRSTVADTRELFGNAGAGLALRAVVECVAQRHD